MIHRTLIFSLLLAATTGTASAQVAGLPAPSRPDMLGMMEQVRQQMNPAAQLLAHRAEMELTPAQTAALDSLAEPMNRFLDEAIASQMVNPASLVVLKMMADPTGEAVEDEEIRAAYREQADSEAETIIRMARIERDVNRVLTPEQRARRVSLNLNSPFGLMRDLLTSMTPAK